VAYEVACGETPGEGATGAAFQDPFGKVKITSRRARDS
jgi:hypothetical protein